MRYLKILCIGLLSLITSSVSAGGTEESTADRSSALFHVSGLVTDLSEAFHVSGHLVHIEIRALNDNTLLRNDSIYTGGDGEFTFNYKPNQLPIVEQYYYVLTALDICSDDLVIFEGELDKFTEESVQLEVCNFCEVQLAEQIEYRRVTFSLEYDKRIEFNDIEWYFGDGFSSSGNDFVEHFYQESGEYDVCVSYLTNYGCYDEVCTTIYIDENSINDQDINNVAFGNKGVTSFDFIQFDNGNTITLIMKEILDSGSGDNNQITKNDINYEVEMISASGRSMYKVESSNNILDLPKFNSGIYYILIKNNSNHKITSLPIVF